MAQCVNSSQLPIRISKVSIWLPKQFLLFSLVSFMILEQHPFLVLWITSLLNPAEPKVTLHKAASKMYVSISLLFSTDLWPNCYYWQRQHCCNGDDLLMMASLAMKMVVMKIINVIWWGGFKYFPVFFLDFPENFSVIFWIFTFLHTVGESHLSSGWIYIFFLMKAWNIETILTTRCKVGQWAQYLAKSWPQKAHLWPFWAILRPYGAPQWPFRTREMVPTHPPRCVLPWSNLDPRWSTILEPLDLLMATKGPFMANLSHFETLWLGSTVN